MTACRKISINKTMPTRLWFYHKCVGIVCHSSVRAETVGCPSGITEWSDKALSSLMKLTSSENFSPSIRISVRLKIHQAHATRSMKISILCYNIGKVSVLQMRNGGFYGETYI